MHYNTIQYNTIQYNTAQYITMHYITYMHTCIACLLIPIALPGCPPRRSLLSCFKASQIPDRRENAAKWCEQE